MQARVANDVPLLRRVAWVEDAIRKLDEGVAAELVLGRLARGLVLADLPSRFCRAPQAIEDLEWCLDHPLDLPFGLDRGIYRGLAAAFAAPETLSEGGLDLALIPAKSGETADALFIHDRKHDLLFVGDAFMPYVGAPVVAEGSPEGSLGAIAMVLELHPRRLIHGHVPLTAILTMEAMPGLRD